MSLIKCNECSNVVSSTAKACPNCGAKVKKGSVLRTLLFAIFGIPLTVGIIAAVVGEADTVSTNASSTNTAQASAINLDDRRTSFARIIAEREVKSRLKAPRGAKFSGIAETEVGKLKDGTSNEWIVKGHVDAENSFGAVIRNHYQVVIEFEEGKYDSSRTKSAELYD